LHIIFYSDRNPAPDDLVVRAKEDGTFEEIKSETNALEGVFREMEVDVVMTAEGVKQLYEFLGKNLGIKT
jgi:cell division protein FtsX